MDLNGILFPSPNFERDVDQFGEELVFIPRDEFNLTHIPALLLLYKLRTCSKNFLILFHGNAEDIFAARDIADVLRSNLLINVLIVEYPGYSIYKDEKCSHKLLDNALIAFDYLVETLNVEPNNIYIFGRSIGTAPSIYLASKRSLGGLILMSPFTSIRAVAENLVGTLFKFLISERFVNLDYIKHVTSPILFIHGQQDTLIPFDHTIKLKTACKCPYEVILPEEMDHNQFDFELDLLIPVKDFLRRLTDFKTGEPSDITIPSLLYQIPGYVVDEINELKEKKEKGSIISCFQGAEK